MKSLEYNISGEFPKWPVNKQMIINTINPHSYCLAKRDFLFQSALKCSDLLIADGIGIVMALKLLNKKKVQRITGADMHKHLLQEADDNNLKVFYLGSSKTTLDKLMSRLKMEYPLLQISSFSPVFKDEFSQQETKQMIQSVNQFSPDILFVGMTAPKQEKWVYKNKLEIDTTVIVSIGAVFDFYAGTIRRAPKIISKMGFEWLYRLLREPRRMWRRYLINNVKFVFYIWRKKF